MLHRLRELFVDAAAWVAIFNERDTNHAIAAVAYQSSYPRYPRLVTTNLVVAESYNLIYRQVGYLTAIRFLDHIAQTKRLTKLYSNEKWEREAEVILRRYKDQDFSLTDAVSFALMEERSIETAFSFDHHFLVAGFTLLSATGR